MLQLKKFPDIPVSTREEARGSHPHPEEARFRLLARDDGYFPCLVGKEIPAFLSLLKRRCSPQERREELQGRATIPRVPQMSQSIQEEPVFPALLRLSRRGSNHTWWHLGKPRGKASRENHRSIDPRDWKHDTAATDREESARACLHSRRGLTPLGRLQNTPRSMSALEKNPQVLAPTPHKVLGPGIEWERNPERPPGHSHGDWPFLRPPERVPEVPVISREHLPQLEKIQEILPSRRDEARYR